MEAIRITATVFVIAFMVIIFCYMRTADFTDNKASLFFFWFMECTYALALIAIWGGRLTPWHMLSI